MKTYLKEGMIIVPNISNVEYGSNNNRLRITQIGMNRVFVENISTGEYIGEIGNYKEVESYYDIIR